MTEDEAAELEQMRLRRVEVARELHFSRHAYTAEDLLIALEPNEAGLYPSHPYRGGKYDEARFRLVRGGWDHDHCWICKLTINPGDEWWAASPDELGLCLDCYEQLVKR